MQSDETDMMDNRSFGIILDNLPGMAYRCLNDPEWTMEFVSKGCAGLTGYAAEHLVGNRSVAYGSLIHEDDRADVWTQVQSAIARESQFQARYRLITATGETKWVWEQGKCVATTPSGAAVIEGIILDITDQRRLEERIGASERRFRALYESANDAIFLMRDERFIDCNPKTEEMFGYPRAQILGNSPIDFSPATQPSGETSRELGLKRIQAAFAGSRQFFEWKHVRADGSEFDAEVSLSRVDIDDGPALLAIVRDVTERTQAFELLEQRVAERTAELRATEARYLNLFERSRDAVFIAVDGCLVDFNDATLELLGAARDEVRGVLLVDFTADVRSRAALEAATSAEGAAIKDTEVVIQRSDGTRRDCLVTAHAYRDVAAGTIVSEGIVRDITEWKRAEEDLFEQSRESAVLDERNRMAREIHDTLAQGLTGIVLQLEAAEQAAETSDGAMNAHIERAKSLARESLQEARRSVWNLVPRVLQDSDLVRAVETEARRFSAGGGARASIQVIGDEYRLPPDVAVSVLRICQESLMNVRKYAQAEQVRVSLRFESERVQLLVQDDGIGFDSAVSFGQEGGFGLVSMKQRAQQHGGTLIVASGATGGTLVDASIPIDPREPHDG